MLGQSVMAKEEQKHAESQAMSLRRLIQSTFPTITPVWGYSADGLETKRLAARSRFARFACLSRTDLQNVAVIES